METKTRRRKRKTAAPPPAPTLGWRFTEREKRMMASACRKAAAFMGLFGQARFDGHTKPKADHDTEYEPESKTSNHD